MRIVFMGTPDFAVPSLEILHRNFSVVAVVTAPDKPAGRGLQVHESPVKSFATANNLKILQPEKLRDETFLSGLKALNADLFVVVAFRMLPEIVWSMPSKGTINLHASLLPDYRGAAPINWAIMNGEKETGLTTFFIQQEIDTGKVIHQKILSVGENETAGELHDRMMNDGAELLFQTVRMIETEKAIPVAQPEISLWKKAPKIFKQDCEIDWTKSIDQIYNFIRGLSPHPGAWTKLNDHAMKIYRAEKIHQPVNSPTGKYKTDGKTFLHFVCNDGLMNVTELQMEGKKKMKIDEFLRGYRFSS